MYNPDPVKKVSDPNQRVRPDPNPHPLKSAPQKRVAYKE